MSARLVDAIYDSTEVNAGVSPALDLNYGGKMVGYVQGYIRD